MDDYMKGGILAGAAFFVSGALFYRFIRMIRA
jgi:hypothetical protein